MVTGAAHARRIGRGVDDLLAHDRLRRRARGRRSAARPCPPRARPARTASATSRRVQANHAHAHARMAAAELGDEVDARVVARGPPGAEGRGPAAQLAHGHDRVARRLGRVERALGVGTQRVARPRSASARGRRAGTAARRARPPAGGPARTATAGRDGAPRRPPRTSRGGTPRGSTGAVVTSRRNLEDMR